MSVDPMPHISLLDRTVLLILFSYPISHTLLSTFLSHVSSLSFLPFSLIISTFSLISTLDDGLAMSVDDRIASSSSSIMEPYCSHDSCGDGVGAKVLGAPLLHNYSFDASSSVPFAYQSCGDGGWSQGYGGATPQLFVIRVVKSSLCISKSPLNTLSTHIQPFFNFHGLKSVVTVAANTVARGDDFDIANIFHARAVDVSIIP